MKILIMSEISENATQVLQKEHTINYKNSLVTQDDSEILIVRSNIHVDFQLLENLPSLKAVIKAGSGTDNLDLHALEVRNIKLFTTPVNEHSVAELALMMILALKKNLFTLNTAIKRGNWNAKYEVSSNNLFKSTLGIIGFGNIGRTLSIFGKAIGMNILIYDHHPFTSIKQECSYEVEGTFVTLEDLLKNSDVVSLHVPLTDKTRNMIGYPEFELFKKGTILINTARADLIHPLALKESLLEQKIEGLGIDVHYNEPVNIVDELINLNNVVATPHVGSQTIENVELIGEKIIELINKIKEEEQ
jgi:D-3-phosphoglycerate dehydrogenase